MFPLHVPVTDFRINAHASLPHPVKFEMCSMWAAPRPWWCWWLVTVCVPPPIQCQDSLANWMCWAQAFLCQLWHAALGGIPQFGGVTGQRTRPKDTHWWRGAEAWPQGSCRRHVSLLLLLGKGFHWHEHMWELPFGCPVTPGYWAVHQVGAHHGLLNDLGHVHAPPMLLSCLTKHITYVECSQAAKMPWPIRVVQWWCVL